MTENPYSSSSSSSHLPSSIGGSRLVYHSVFRWILVLLNSGALVILAVLFAILNDKALLTSMGLFSLAPLIGAVAFATRRRYKSLLLCAALANLLLLTISLIAILDNPYLTASFLNAAGVIFIFVAIPLVTVFSCAVSWRARAAA